MVFVTTSSHPSRRRAIVFAAVFLPAVIGSLVYVYTRPPEYRAVARLQISPASVVTQPAEATDTPTLAPDPQGFLSEVQALTSRPVLQDAVQRLRKNGALPDLGSDPIAFVQQMMHADPVEGTQIVRLSAVGRQQEFVPLLVNTVVQTYEQHVADAYEQFAAANSGEVKDEIGKLDKEVTTKRQQVEAFRQQYDIVSIEHKENDVLANIEGLSRSYTLANEKLAQAQGHLQALRNSVAAGKAVFRAKDDPTLSGIEQRASILREQWHELERRFTPNYLALDGDAKSLKARLDDLDSQLQLRHGQSERAALAEAQQDLSSAQTEVDRLRQDVADNRKEAEQFSTHLNEYKAMREDLDHLEGMRRAALDHLTKLQASARERAPRVQLVEAAAPSQEPWRPNYALDAVLSVAASLGLGLFAAWFADFIAGPAPAPFSPFLQYAWAPALAGHEAMRPPLLAAPDFARLPAPEPPPRELANSEIAALVAATTDDARLIVVGLLMGMTVQELVALDWDKIDLSAGAIRFGDGSARIIPMEEPLRRLLAARQVQQPKPTGAVLHGADGRALAADEISRTVLFAAYDAGLDRPQEVTAEALRYTYLSFLLRQGIRAADIGRIAGDIPQNELIAYMQMHSPTARRPLDQIDRVHPGLRELVGIG